MNKTPPVVTPTNPIQYQSVSTTDGTWSGHPTLTRWWQQNTTTDPATFINIPGATSSTFTSDPGYEGRYLRSAVSDGSVTVYSTPVGPVVGLACTTSPSFPAPSVGNPVTVTNGSWVYCPTNVAPTFSYQWTINPTGSGVYTPITGATSSTYTPTAGDQGQWIDCLVTATNGQASTTVNSGPHQVA